MTYPPIPAPEAIAADVVAALRSARREETPYRRWSIERIFPEQVCTGILVLPVVPPMLGATDGSRDSYNRLRCFFTPELRRDFPVCEALSVAMQSPEVARQFSETCELDADGTHLRMEYMQDTDGMWLEPHRDIHEKIFSMVIYLCTGPEAKDWGTDIYNEQVEWVGRSNAKFNSATIFKAGPATWHGFEKRPIKGVRRLMEVNYVRNWRDRDQLAFPDRPISTS